MQGYGAKVDARLKALEARLSAAEVEDAKRKAGEFKDEGMMRRLAELTARIEALEAKRGPGRPRNG